MIKRPNHIIAFYGEVPVSTSSSVLYNVNPTASYVDKYPAPDAVNLVDSSSFSQELAPGSIAYHPIFGDIYYRSKYYFSILHFIENLIEADKNPSIVAHIIHVNSCGGEAFGCNKAYEIVKSLTKPVIAVIDTVSASAGYYLIAAADKIYASDEYSMTGCIGVMSVMYDDKKFLESLGFEERKYYSNYSPLKNKVFDDAVSGDGKEYVKRFLDPLALEFVNNVKLSRPEISEAAQQGDTFYSSEAISSGLIDGVKTLDQVISELNKNNKIPSSSIDINNIDF